MKYFVEYVLVEKIRIAEVWAETPEDAIRQITDRVSRVFIVDRFRSSWMRDEKEEDRLKLNLRLL